MSIGSDLKAIPFIVNTAKTGVNVGLNAIPVTVKAVINIGKTVIGNLAGYISDSSGPLVSATGYVLENAPSLTSAGVFGYLTWHGGKMFAVPFRSKAKWFSFENRFKKTPELKAKPINLTELIKKTSEITDGASKVIANQKTEAAKKAKDLADEALRNAQAAKKALNDAEESVKLADQALDKAITDNVPITIKNDLVTAAFEEQGKLDEARKIDIDKLFATATDLQKKADEAKKASESASEQLKNIQSVTNPKKDAPASQSDNYMMTYTVEMSKPKSGHTQIPLPLSDEAIVISHEDLKKEFTSLAAGTATLGVGILGMIDSAPESVSSYIFSRILDDNWAWWASKIGSPVHYATDCLGNTVGWIIQKDHYGLGKLAAAGSLFFGSHYLIKKTNLVWFNFAKDKNGPLVKRGVIVKDIALIASSITLFCASILTANEWLNSNYKWVDFNTEPTIFDSLPSSITR